MADRGRVATPSRRCGGRPRACGSWRGRLREQGHQVSFTLGREVPARPGVFSLQANRKTLEGRLAPRPRRAVPSHQPDRDEAAVAAGSKRVISVDYQEEGADRRFQERRPRVAAAGRAGPGPRQGLQGQAAREGHPLRRLRPQARRGVRHGRNRHDTAQFAVNAIRSWWRHLGRERYPDAPRLTITADCGGSNGNRTRLWKAELQQPRRRDRA